VENEEGIPAAEPNEEQNNDGASYHDRIRNEGEFAVGEVQKKDSYIGQLHEKVNAYKGIEQYVEAAGGVEQLIELAIEGNRVRAEAAEKANAPAVEEKDPLDEIYDDEVRAVASRYEKELAARDERINAMDAQLSQMSVSTAKTGLMENIGTALADFEGYPELEAKAKEAIMGAVESSERLAKSGDKSAVANLEQLASDAGPKVIQMMTAGIYREMALAKRDATKTEPNETTKQHSTESSSTTRSRLGEDNVVVRPGARVTANSVREVLEALAEKRGKDPAKLFG